MENSNIGKNLTYLLSTVKDLEDNQKIKILLTVNFNSSNTQHSQFIEKIKQIINFFSNIVFAGDEEKVMFMFDIDTAKILSQKLNEIGVYDIADSINKIRHQLIVITPPLNLARDPIFQQEELDEDIYEENNIPFDYTIPDDDDDDPTNQAIRSHFNASIPRPK